MVEQSLLLDDIFASLADPTRRDILNRLQRARMNITEIAEPYDMSLAAISKHLIVLEKAKLILKRKKGKEHIVQLVPSGLAEADKYLRQYQDMWQSRFDKLEALLQEEE